MYFSIPVVVRGYKESGIPFEEITDTVDICSDGGLIQLQTPVRDEQLLLLKNGKTGEETVCYVVSNGNSTDGRAHVGVRFFGPSLRFWGLEFLREPCE